MKLIKNAFVLGLVAFWAVITSHCGLENLPVLSFLACESEFPTSAHQSSDCGDKDACATVESGLYKSEERPILIAKPTLIFAALASLQVSYTPLSERLPGTVASVTAPPGSGEIWRFAFRTALPPRAPSILA